MGTTAALMAVAVLTGFAMPAQAAVSIESDGTVKAEAADINALNNLLKNGVTTTTDGSVTVGGLTVKKNGEVSVNNSPDVVYGKMLKSHGIVIIPWDRLALEIMQRLSLDMVDKKKLLLMMGILIMQQER